MQNDSVSQANDGSVNSSNNGANSLSDENIVLDETFRTSEIEFNN